MAKKITGSPSKSKKKTVKPPGTKPAPATKPEAKAAPAPVEGSSRTFSAEIRGEGPGAAWCFVTLPFDAGAAYGTNGRVSVKLTIAGEVFRTSIFPTGDGTHHLMFNKTMQKAANAGQGGTATMTIERDDAPRTFEVPAELAAALAKNNAAKAKFEAYSSSHKNEYCAFVAEAKKEETRTARADKAIERLLAGKRIK